MTEVTDAMVEALWAGIASLCGDYSEVPAADIMRRPRYQGVPPVLREALTAALSAAPDPWRPIAEYDPKIEPYGLVLCDITKNHFAIVAKGPPGRTGSWTDTALNAVERPQRFMRLPKLERR